MPLTKAQKNTLELSTALEPQSVSAKGSHALRLHLPSGKKIELVKRDGTVTESGKYWFGAIRKEAVPEHGFEIEQEPFRKQGTRTDFILMKDGRKAAVRTWHPSKGTFSYTATGKQYFEQRPRQYIVSIPAINHFQRKDGH